MSTLSGCEIANATARANESAESRVRDLAHGLRDVRSVMLPSAVGIHGPGEIIVVRML
jgi:hypothetical protein